jgi:signal transduction histidine kinase
MTSQKISALSITVERLSRSEIFSELSKEDLVSIAENCREETYREGEVILVEGKPAEKLFIVERGKLALDKKIQIGLHSTPRTATIGYIGTGQIAGFSTLASPHVYSTSAVCVEPVRVISIDGEWLRSYLQAHPEVGFKVMSELTMLIGSRYRYAINTLTYFLSIVSHELRSPLAAIESNLQLMLGGFVGEPSPKLERLVKRSIIRLSDMRSLIGDVVDLARMRPEQIQADFDWFDPGEVGAESIEDVHLAAVEKEIRIKIEPPAKFEPMVGARRRLRQVFTNLLNNAVKFSPEGSTVFFRAWYEPEAVIFEIEDSGPGIPPDELPHVFEDFFRASNVATTQGSGLGLSIAKKIMDAHNGKILIRNLSKEEDGKSGIRFTVVIPSNLKTPEMRRRQWLEAEIQEIGS